MAIAADQDALFQFVFASPSDDHIRRLTPLEYEQFIYYLFERDGLYKPVLVDGPGDGGVDIELHARNGLNPSLRGVVQCKRNPLDNVSAERITLLDAAARKANAERRYFFTTSGYTSPARREARTNDINLFDSSDVRFWIQDIRRREALGAGPDISGLENIPIPIVCIANNKGGVGKTTLTGNLAAALATEQRGVLVIDADPQGHLTFWMTAQARPAAPLSLHAVLTQEWPIWPLLQKTVEKNVWILPASRELVDISNGPSSWQLERRLAQALVNLPLADPPIGYILIDTPPALSTLTKAALIASSSLLMPLQLDMFSREGLGELVTFIGQVETAHQKPPVKILGGVATMVDQGFRWGLSYRDKFPEVTEHSRLSLSGLGPQNFWCGTIRNRGDFRKAQYEHKSVLRFARSSDAAKDITQLAKEVTSRVPVLVHQTS